MGHTVNTISGKEPNAIIVLGGDFNMLPENKVIEATSFLPLIQTPTRLYRSHPGSPVCI